jgi:hypothetical protein
MAPLWNCEICCEDFHDYTSTEIEGSPVCPSCVREMFDNALKFEHEYPPRWGVALHPSEFSHIISKDFTESYKNKEIEYKTQPSRRIYCQHMLERVVVQESGVWETLQEPCGEFIGVRQRLSKPDVLVLGRCKECKNATCMVCDDYSSDPAATLQHVCTGKSSANEQRAQAFIGLKRGREWQQCPNRLCGRRIELSAACNHITCTCGTGFCFICGKEAEGESSHWALKSGCPRYNHPDDRNAEYDDYDGDDDESIADTENEPGDDEDPLEDVRGLFDADGGSEELTAVLSHMTTRMEEMVTAAVAVADRVTLSFANLPAEMDEVITAVDADELSTEHFILTGDGHVPETVLPPAVDEPFPLSDEEEATLPDTQEEASQEAEDVLVGRIRRRVLELQQERAQMLAPTRQMALHVPEPTPISTPDVEAIANAYLEDDLSDMERDARELLVNADSPAVTMEEADIDRTLWRLHVD